MNLGASPFTGNRYAFGGGNPISAIEIDGHCWDWAQDVCDAAESAAEWVDHNSDALTDLAVDTAEIILGSAAIGGGITMVAGGISACVASVPALVGVVTAPITGAACAGGAAAALGGGALAVGGVAMVAHGASNWWDDLKRFESPRDGDGVGSWETPKPDNPTRRDDRWLKWNGVDPHTVKDGLPGQESHFDLYVDKNDNIFAVRKGTDPNEGLYVGNMSEYK